MEIIASPEVVRWRVSAKYGFSWSPDFYTGPGTVQEGAQIGITGTQNPVAAMFLITLGPPRK